MSKKTVSIPTTVEAQIRTRARNLPIHKCYINKDWEKVQMANIIITRSHTNGNITMGNFLIDLKLYGVKDCTYKFNESPLRIDEILDRKQDMYEECDYALAHNIIYAGLEFAEDYGFAPHKNFKTAQYLLQEDNDDVPIIDVPLGDNGIPILEIPYGEDKQREMTILDNSAGDDYRVVYFDENGKPEVLKRSYMELFNEAMEFGLDKYWEKHSDTDSLKEVQVMTDLIYLMKVYTEEDRSQIDANMELITKDPRLTMKSDNPTDDHEEELSLAYNLFLEGKNDEAVIEIYKLIDIYPDDPLLWDVLLYDISVDSDIVDDKAVKEAYSRFPDHPFIKAWYAEWLVQEDRSEEIFTLFNNIPGFDALTEENTYININTFISFCFAYALAWLDKEDVFMAEPYYQIIARLDIDYRLSEFIQEKMTFLKREKLKVLDEEGFFGDLDNED